MTIRAPAARDYDAAMLDRPAPERETTNAETVADWSFVNEIDKIRELGLSLNKILTARRGCAVLKMSGESGRYALKIADPPSQSRNRTDIANMAVDRERHALRRLFTYTGKIYVAHGEHAGRKWLLMRWIEGRTAQALSKRIRDTDSPDARRDKMLRLTAAVFKQVAKLHDRDFVHGDLQAAHFLIEPSKRLRLIDFALSGRQSAGDNLYRGSPAEYVAPETARAKLAGEKKIKIDKLSEIYSAAAVAFRMYTGKAPAFGKIDNIRSLSWDERFSIVASSQRCSFKDLGAPEFPAFEDVLSWCLEPEREARCPDLWDAVRALERIAGSPPG